MAPLNQADTDAFFQVVETVNDRIAEAPTLLAALSESLAVALRHTGRQGGAIFIPLAENGAPDRWIAHSPASIWEEQIADPASPLRQAVDQSTQAGQTGEGIPLLDLAGVYPLVAKIGVQGALLIRGTPCSEEEEYQWSYLARTFGRAIVASRNHRPDDHLHKDLIALKIFASSLNADSNVTDVQLWIVRGIKELLNSQAAILLILDDENPDIAIRKTIVDQPEWHSREVLKVESSLAMDCIRSGQPYYVADVSGDPIFNPKFDAVDNIPVGSVFCTPLISNSQTLGVVEVINLPQDQLNPNELSLLASMAKSLANSIFSLHLIQQLKVINADLEASRWELLHSRNTLRTLFDSIPASIYIVDHRYTLIAINMSRSDRTRNRPNLLVGQNCYTALYHRSEPCPGCRVKETLLTGETTNRTDREWINNEQAVDWDISTFAIQDAPSLPAQAIVVEQDITEKRRLEANLIQNEKLAAVGQLAAGVAHEINNPLSAIIANAQLLIRDLPDADIQELLKLIETAGLRASQVVRNLLDFARKEQYNFDRIDLNDTINASLSLIQHKLVSRPIHLSCDLQENLPKIYASRDHLQGVWINLVMNAIDAIENEHGRVEVVSRFVVNEFRVMINDNGIGIPPERVSRIFEPFFTTKATGRGTGLGLSVCQRIVKQHGGCIQVESQAGEGTRFTVIIPENPNGDQ